jgi:hypothetical protein
MDYLETFVPAHSLRCRIGNVNTPTTRIPSLAGGGPRTLIRWSDPQRATEKPAP